MGANIPQMFSYRPIKTWLIVRMNEDHGVAEIRISVYQRSLAVFFVVDPAL